MQIETMAPPAKAVAGHSYVHRDCVGALSVERQARVFDAEELSGSSAWNVAKLSESGRRVSLLTYEDFEAPFPALLESTTVELESKAIVRRSYRARHNPPILHRKELLLDTSDPRREAFAKLTSELEQRGLFRDPRFIGTRRAWEQRLAQAGVAIEDHAVIELSDRTPSVEIQRHLAAIRRDGLSTPIRNLIRYGLIDREASVFDYGCGHGSDIEGLCGMGIAASGWDPHYSPNSPRTPADIVNLGFVLNVIERPAERLNALRAAYALAGRCLAVAVITSSSARPQNARPYGDGLVTSLGTFQKFYLPSELKALLEKTVGREAFQVAPGLFFVFPDPVAEQEFLLRRQQGRRTPAPKLQIPPRASEAKKVEAAMTELEALWEVALALGRWPAADELDADLVVRLGDHLGSLAKAQRLTASLFDQGALVAAFEQRRGDLLVYLALNIFNRRTAYRQLPQGLQRHMKAHFGDYSSAQEAGRRLLFSIGDQARISQGCVDASAGGLGFLEPGEGYWIDKALADRLSPELRCFVGSAERYFGGLEEMDLIKIHLRSAKLTALRYRDFERSPFPSLLKRVKIDLRDQRILESDHSSEDQRLILKSRFMASDQPGYARQKVFDEHALSIGFPAEDVRMDADGVADIARAAGYVVEGFQWTALEAEVVDTGSAGNEPATDAR